MVKKYWQSEKGKIAHKRAQDKYDKTEKGKLSHRKYHQSEKGRAANQKRVKRWIARNIEKNRQLHKQIYIKNRGILHELKINGCAICGYNKCDTSLDFHHINSEGKKFTITATSTTKKNFINELQKCILLCSNCHGEIHQKEREDKCHI